MNMNFRTSPLARRLILLMLLATIPATLIGVLILYFGAASYLRTGADEKLATTAENLAIKVEAWEGDVVRDLYFFSRQTDIISMNPERQCPILRQFVKNYPTMKLAHTIYPDGIDVARSDDLDMKDYHDREYFKQAISGQPIEREILISRTTNRPALSHAVPIIQADGRVVGVLSTIMELGTLTETIGTARYSQTGYSCLVDAQGRALAHPDLKMATTLQDMSSLPPVAGALRERISRSYRFQDQQGIWWLAHTVPLTNGWSVISLQQESEVLAQVHGIFVLALLVMLATAGIKIIFTWAASRHILRPISLMTVTAKRIAHGNWSQRMEEGRADELGILARSFNEMVEELIQMNEASKQKSVALEESERALRRLIETASEGIWMIDAEGKTTFVNAMMGEILGYTPQEMIGQFLLSYMDLEGQRVVQEIIARRHQGMREQHEFRFHRKNGGEVWTLVSSKSIFDSAGHYTGVLGMVTDITERKRAEEARRDQERLTHREAVKAMEQVLGVVGHELRTPLAGLRAISEFLLTDAARESEQGEIFLRQLNAETVRMADMINDLLEAARLNSGRARWNWSQVDLKTVCQEALETVRPLVNEARVELALGVIPPDAVMRGDADAIRRLLINLLSNARKHTIKGQISIHAVVAKDGDETWTSIEVRDTGAGIPAHRLGRMGEAFALNAGVVGIQHIEGTGLGLAICKGIAAAHGGYLAVASTKGQGTTITVRLRADLPEPARNGEQQPLTIKSDQSPAGAVS